VVAGSLASDRCNFTHFPSGRAWRESTLNSLKLNIQPLFAAAQERKRVGMIVPGCYTTQQVILYGLTDSMSGAFTLAGTCPAPFLLTHTYRITFLRLQGLGARRLRNAGLDHVERLAELLLGHI
jgi:hypothetical protein